MKRSLILMMTILLLGCKSSKEEQTTLNNKNENTLYEKPNYVEFKKNIATKSNPEKQKYFFTYINSDVPFYWQGTPWSFNGTSSEPKVGSVACGYFVTNVLKNYGFNIKASYLAQQASSVMIKQLCNEIKYFSKTEDLEKYLMNGNKNQVYIIGLDFHTGFVTRENKDTYFIHSNYIKNKGVVKEKIPESKALNASKTFMIGHLKF